MMRGRRRRQPEKRQWVALGLGRRRTRQEPPQHPPGSKRSTPRSVAHASARWTRRTTCSATIAGRRYQHGVNA